MVAPLSRRPGRLWRLWLLLAALLPLPAAAEIVLDGAVDEPAWGWARSFPDTYRQVYPKTLEQSPHPMQARAHAARDALYLSVVAEQPPEGILAVPQRHDQLAQGDMVQFWVDSAAKQSSAHVFGISANGDRMEGAYSSPAAGVDSSWDGQWEGKVRRTDKGWSAEIRIPWTSLNMTEAPEGERKVRVTFARRLGQSSRWFQNPGVSFREPHFLASFYDLPVGEVRVAGLKLWGAASGGDRDPPADDRRRVERLGVEGRWRVSVGQVVDFTLAPDFTDAEADQVDLNFSSFETLFAEKRRFFNEDIEALQINVNSARMLHTRRIGEAVDLACTEFDEVEACQKVDDRNESIPLLMALKYRRQGQGSDLAMLTAVEEAEDDFTQGRSFLALRGRNSLGATDLGWILTAVRDPNVAQTPTGGSLGFDVRSRPGKGSELRSLLFVSQAASAGRARAGGSLRWQLEPSAAASFRLELEAYQDGLDLSDLGYLRRDDLLQLRARGEFRVPGRQGGGVQQHIWTLRTQQEANFAGQALAQRYFAEYRAFLRSGGEWWADLGYRPPGINDSITVSTSAPRVDTPEYFWGGIFFRGAPSGKFRVSGGLGLPQHGILQARQSAFARVRLEWTPGRAGRFSLGLERARLPAWTAKRSSVLDVDYTDIEAEETGHQYHEQHRDDVLLVEYERTNTKLNFGWSYAHRRFGEFALVLDSNVTVGRDGKSIRVDPVGGLHQDYEGTSESRTPDFRRSGLSLQLRYELAFGKDSRFSLTYKRGGDRTQYDGSADGFGRGFWDGLDHVWDQSAANDLVLSLQVRLL